MNANFETLLRLADDHLILGHRLSEWCGHAPMLEEDLALPNIALDLIGQARALYEYAGKVEGKGRDEDTLAYLRSEREYVNLLMVEQPKGDFAYTILRQFYFAVYMEAYWNAAMASTDETLAGIAAKAVKEATYHVRHTGEWTIRLGDGTEESARRMAEAVEDLSPFVGEMFMADDVTEAATSFAPDPASLRAAWDAKVAMVFEHALLTQPTGVYPQTGGRQGHHGEVMGHLLADLQFMQRAYPGMKW